MRPFAAFSARWLAIFLFAWPVAVPAADAMEQMIAHGDYVAALVLLEHQRDAAQKAGRHDRAAAAVFNNLGAVYSQLGRTRDAQLAYEKSLAVWRDLGLADSRDAARTLGNLGAVYAKLNLVGKAEDTLERAASLAQRLGGDLEATKIWVNLGQVYESEHRWDDAEKLFRDTIEIRERELGPANLEVALALNNLGVLLENRKRLTEAEPLLARAVRIWETAAGPKHPWLAAGFNNLAIVYSGLGQLDQAETDFRRAIEIAAAELPADHPDLATYRLSYAQLLRKLGRKGEARQLEQEARTARREHDKENMLGYTVDARGLENRR